MKEISVVFQVRDMDKFRQDMPEIFNSEETLPYTITGMSNSNEFSRVELIEEIINTWDFDRDDKVTLIEEVLALHGDNIHEKGCELIEEWKLL
jgi:hypothetical protein